MFQAGTAYSRDDIHAELGGSKQACLLTKHGAVIGVCFVPDMNPRGPNVILVGRGPQKEKAAGLFASQAGGVPVFKKQATNAWEFVGNFKADRYLTSTVEAFSFVDGSGRHDVAGVLLLNRIS